jgi:hypothetical protein
MEQAMASTRPRPGAPLEGWRLLVLHRGRHGPPGKAGPKTLDRLPDAFAAAGVPVLAVPSDPAEKAAAEVAAR